MGGVDLADQYLCYSSLGRKTMKWWRRVFWRLIDMAILNAYVFYRHNTHSSLSKVLKNNEFLITLAYDLVSDLVSSRCTSRSPIVLWPMLLQD